MDKNSQPEDANTLNKHIYKELDSLSQRDFDLSAKVGKIDGLELIPDGMIEIRSSNSRKFDYRLSVQDYSYFQYHRNNGITKIGIVQPGTEKINKTEEEKRILEDTGNTTYIMRPSEGAMQLADRMNNAYIRSIFNDTYIVSG